ncbi:Glucokinase [Aquisphaera giovannonii]|uniref:Glucokinase n=1 Tax=Aquisphaera giovannonii TaxID=406548 RepID=A0A5B9VYI7_9BACT|nr:ROK family protein [Aquisphaera giovannonii]QEH33044.1 Glucokinase [Aquisphaera giovannonii]
MASGERRPPYYLGIDLGGTNIKAGVVDDAGKALSSVSVETLAEHGPDSGIDRLAEAAGRAVGESGIPWADVAGVGLGSPGTMDLSRGVLLEPSNLPGWDQFPIRDRLAERLQKRTVLENDANAAALGEHWVGAGRDSNSLVLFTLGTGIGCGIIHEGRVLQGRHSHGGECGHMIIQADDGRLCSCGRRGHLEAYASATSLVKRAVEALAEDDAPSLLRDLAPAELTSLAIDEAARSGDALASRLMSETARYLAVGAVSVMHTVDPDLILFGGGMIGAGRPFLDEIHSRIRSLTFAILARAVRVEYAELGGEAGFIGAAACIRAAVGGRG